MSNDEPERTPKSKWRKRLVAVVCIVLGVVLVNGGMGVAADKADDGAKRDPETGVLHGAEERWLGPENSPGAVLFVHVYYVVITEPCHVYPESFGSHCVDVIFYLLMICHIEP